MQININKQENQNKPYTLYLYNVKNYCNNGHPIF